MYPLFRPFLFRLDPEDAHHLTLQLVRLAGVLPPSRWLLQGLFSAPESRWKHSGCILRIRLGWQPAMTRIALPYAGWQRLVLDISKSGRLRHAPNRATLGHVFFRLVEDQAVINRMGFPGQGAGFAAAHLQKALKGRPTHGNVGTRKLPIIGINLGKNKILRLKRLRMIMSH